MPADLIEAPPPPPKLNVLTLGGRQSRQLQLPAVLIKEYSRHPKFAQQFNDFLETFHHEFGVAELIEDSDPETPSKKRTAGQDLEQPESVSN